jgi:hypothetical protein
MYERMFQVDEPKGQRWAAALELLKDGTPVVIKGIAMQPGEDEFHVSVVSRWQKPNEHAAREQIDRARSLLDDLLSSDSRFTAVLGGRPLKIELVDDYGMGATTICSVDDDGTLRWS